MTFRRVALAAGCAVLAALGGPAAGAAQSVSAHLGQIREALRDAEEAGMNGVILIRAANRDLLHEAYGALDREAGRAMTIDAGFDIGSLVKPITAIAVLRLEELGELSVRDRLIDYFPETPPEKADITIWQLLTHTSGLPDIFGDDYDVVSRDWVLERALGAELLGPPGFEERYSNVGYSLLAMIVEDVSGMPFERFVRREVLLPAETPELGYVLAGWRNERLAVGYRRDRRWGTPLDHAWAADGPGWNLRGNGGMLGTAESMARWYEALFDERIVGAEAAAKFYEFDAGESRSVGGRSLGHAGGNGIFNTLQVSWIDHDVHMTFFTSTARPLNAETVWEDISEDVIAIARLVAGAE
ncbi:MAG: beta-lactamase family protein [Gemmatimonadetes bacterium]|nr:beta-lactamase family protein [Gemmatimonadota bacterium]